MQIYLQKYQFFDVFIIRNGEVDAKKLYSSRPNPKHLLMSKI